MSVTMKESGFTVFPPLCSEQDGRSCVARNSIKSPNFYPPVPSLYLFGDFRPRRNFQTPFSSEREL